MNAAHAGHGYGGLARQPLAFREDTCAAAKGLGATGRQLEPFGMRVRAVNDVSVIELHGELDLVAHVRLTPQIDFLTPAKRPVIVIDLGGVTFMDVYGLRLLLRTRIRVLERGGTLHVLPDTHQVARILRLTGTKPDFCLLETLPPHLTA
ncbi:STAS domain-containing protein [Streptomyces sp. NPDC058268]|uniref:STAS domain-containing protein n=1 Tax=Streptomyces sp. NPDC058268 TaxID=3346413 RepID=UPI0036EEA406